MRRALALIPALVLLAACVGPGQPAATRPTGPVPYAWTQPLDHAGSGGDSALLKGTVRDQNGCLVVEADGGVSVPVFAWTRVSADDGGWVAFVDGRLISLHPGAEVEFAGGNGPTIPEDVIPEACPVADVFRVVDY